MDERRDGRTMGTIKPTMSKKKDVLINFIMMEIRAVVF
jgi:hypothetical protein